MIGLFLLYFVICYLILFLLHLLVFAVVGYTMHMDRLPADIHTFYRWYGFETLLLFMGSLRIRVHLHGMERMPEKGVPFLLVSNHRSIFDPLVGLTSFKP